VRSQIVTSSSELRPEELRRQSGPTRGPDSCIKTGIERRPQLSESRTLGDAVADEDIGCSDHAGVQFLLALGVGADGSDVKPGMKHRGVDQRFVAGVVVATISDAATRSATVSATSNVDSGGGEDTSSAKRCAASGTAGPDHGHG
jgi:hypothetical protein